MPHPCDPLRARTLQAQRRSLESKLMQPQSTVTCVPHAFRFAAGTLPGRRRVPAQFPRLSRSEQGRSKLTYVKKEDLATVRQHCAAYRAFQQNLKEWRRVTAALQQRWKLLQQAQSR